MTGPENGIMSIIYSPPSQQDGEEHVLRDIHNYGTTSFLNGHWKSNSPSQLCESLKGGKPARSRLSKFHDLALNAINHIYIPNPMAYFRLMNLCFDAIKTLLEEEDPFLLADLLDITVHLYQRGLYDIVQMFVEYVKDMSEHIFGSAHAIPRLWKFLYSMETLDAKLEFVYRAFDMLITLFEKQLGPEHASTFILYSHRSLFKGANPSSAVAKSEDWFWQKLKEVEMIDPTTVFAFCYAIVLHDVLSIVANLPRPVRSYAMSFKVFFRVKVFYSVPSH